MNNSIKETDPKITGAFKNRVRLRLPGMHEITAENAGVPLRNQIASSIFMNLHSEFNHNCVFIGDLAWDTPICPAHFSMAEWSFLPEEFAAPFYQMAEFAIDETQLWVASGSCEVINLPAYGGPILIANPDFKKAAPEDFVRKPSQHQPNLVEVIAKKFFEVAHPRLRHDCSGIVPKNEWRNLPGQQKYLFYLAAGIFGGAWESVQRWVGGGIQAPLSIAGVGSVVLPNEKLVASKIQIYPEKQADIDYVNALTNEIGKVPLIP